MKIECSACGASYQIDDRKVTGTGRVFRISCRACQSPILVEGLEGQGAGLSGWYLDEGGRREGPMELDALRERLAGGAVGEQALIWSNGMDQWRPVSELDEIVAPWEAETVQSDEDEVEDPTTLISLDEIARVHAELEARDAPILSDDEVELIEEVRPPDLPPMAPPASLAETVQRPSADEVETAQSDPQEEDEEESQTLVFKLDPSTLGGGSALPEASEVITPTDTGEDLHEVAGSAAALFRLDDLALGNEAKSATSIEEGGVGLSSSSLFIGDHAKPTDPAAVQARPRAQGTVTTNVPIVKKKKGTSSGFVIGTLVGLAISIPFFVFGGDSDEQKSASPAEQASITPETKEAPPEPTQEKPAQAPEAPAPKEPTAPAAQAKEAAAPAAPEAPAAVKAEPEPSEEQASPRGDKAKKPKPSAGRDKAPANSDSLPAPSSSPKPKMSAEERARIRAARRKLREEPLPNFGRAPRRSAKKQPTPSRGDSKASEKPSSVNALLGQLKNKSGSSDAAEQEQIPQKLSASEVRSTLRKRQGRFKSCYRKMADRPEGPVTIKTSFKIASSGRVSSAQIITAPGVDATVKSCIVEAIKGAKFPRFRDPEMIVNYPILLR